MLSIGINVMWIAGCRYVLHGVEPHKHQFYHYLYVINGTGVISIDGCKYVLQKNHLYMVPINVVHSFAPEGNGFKTIEIKFSLTDERLIDKVNMLPYSIHDMRLSIKHSLEVIMENGIREKIYYKDIINIRFADTLFSLLEENHFSSSSFSAFIPVKEDSIQPDTYLAGVLSYMSNNLSSDIQLDTLAKVVNLTPSYFSKMFKQIYGKPPIHYLNEMRIAKAKELLKYADMSITQISFEVGFQSIHYFSRCFTRKQGISPQEYRNRHKNNIYIKIEQGFD